jgi:predicted RNA methylase
MQHFNLQPGQIFYDLGCGDGRFLLAAEQKGAKAIGFEISPWAYFRGRFNLWRHKSQAKIIFKNFYYQNISDADAVFCFLIDTVMPKVEKKLREELKPDAKIICYGFKLPTWPPVEIIEVKKGFSKSSKIYLYQKS